MNLEASFLTSLEKVAESIMTCLSIGVLVKISVMSLPMSRKIRLRGILIYLFVQASYHIHQE